jgi:hypothetical protein
MKKLSVLIVLGAGLMVLFSHPASAQWVQRNGPFDGEIFSFAVSGNNIYAGTWGEGFIFPPLGAQTVLLSVPDIKEIPSSHLK